MLFLILSLVSLASAGELQSCQFATVVPSGCAENAQCVMIRNDHAENALAIEQIEGCTDGVTIVNGSGRQIVVVDPERTPVDSDPYWLPAIDAGATVYGILPRKDTRVHLRCYVGALDLRPAEVKFAGSSLRVLGGLVISETPIKNTRGQVVRTETKYGSEIAPDGQDFSRGTAGLPIDLTTQLPRLTVSRCQ